MIGDWVFGAIAVLALLHGTVLLYAYRRAGGAGGDDRQQIGTSDTKDGIECGHCGEHNEQGYRFCRRCVSELPASATVFQESTTPWSRRTL